MRVIFAQIIAQIIAVIFCEQTTVHRKLRRLSVRFFCQIASKQSAIMDAVRWVDLYLLIQISSAPACRVCCHACWHVSKSLGASGKRRQHTEMQRLVTGCMKWHVPAACWNEHVCTLHSRRSTFDLGVSGRALSSSHL